MRPPVAAARLVVSSRNEIVGDPRSRGLDRVGRLARPALIAGSFLLVALAVVGPMFAAALGAIDDHEILTLQPLLEQRGPLETWLATDAGSGRFRPLYWVAYIGEVALWGQKVTGWYVDRLLLALATLAAGYWLARLWLRPAIAVPVAILMVVGPQAEAFARLGPQEALGVPLTLVGFALIGRRRFATGLALATSAAFVKEPFALSALLAVAWSWHLGSRRAALVAGSGVALAAAGIARALLLAGGLEQASLGGLGFAGRYLYPFVLLAAIAGGWAVSRVRFAPLLLIALIPLNLAAATNASVQRAAETRLFQATIADLRADSRPLVVVVARPELLEYARAIRVYLPSTPMKLVSSASSPGFQATVAGECIEVDVGGLGGGLCQARVSVP